MGRWLGGREPGRTRVLPQLSASMGCEFSVAIISLHGFMGSQGEVETTMDTVLLGKGRLPGEAGGVGSEANRHHRGSHRGVSLC